jgi:hypothetical protein
VFAETMCNIPFLVPIQKAQLILDEKKCSRCIRRIYIYVTASFRRSNSNRVKHVRKRELCVGYPTRENDTV